MVYNPNSFIRTTDVYDIDVIQDLDVTSDEFKFFLVRLRQSVNDISLVLNQKVSGYCVNEEFLSGKVFEPENPDVSTEFRDGYHKFMIIGPLANSATTTAYPHNIDFGADPSQVTFTKVVGHANNTTTGRSQRMPYASATGTNVIEIYADRTNVYIVTNKNESAFNVNYIELEYIKSRN